MKQDQINSSKQDLTPKLTATRMGNVKRRKPSSLKPVKSITRMQSLRPIKRQQALK